MKLRNYFPFFLILASSASLAISCSNKNTDPVSEVEVTKLEIPSEIVSLAPMSSAQLSVVIYPSDAQYEWIRWSSSDESIASVDENGLVTGKKEGECTITVTSDNGTSASCTVDIVQKTIDKLIGNWAGTGKNSWKEPEDVSFHIDVIDKELVFSDIKFGSGVESEKGKEIYGCFDDNTNKVYIYPIQPFNSYDFSYIDGSSMYCYVALIADHYSGEGYAIFSFDKDADELKADAPVYVGVFSHDEAMEYYGGASGLAAGFVINKVGD